MSKPKASDIPRFVVIDFDDPGCPNFGATPEQALEAGQGTDNDDFKDGDQFYVYRLVEIYTLQRKPTWRKDVVK